MKVTKTFQHSFLISFGFSEISLWIYLEKVPSLSFKTAQLKHSSEYLDNCLKPIDGDSPDIIKKNKIRETINSYFKYRNCHCLVRPVNDEKQLQKIEEVSLKDMKPMFV